MSYYFLFNTKIVDYTKFCWKSDYAVRNLYEHWTNKSVRMLNEISGIKCCYHLQRTIWRLVFSIDTVILEIEFLINIK